MENIIKQIQNYKPFNKQEEKDKETILKYLDEFENFLTRDNQYGHLCSSAFVLNKERNKIIMIYHNIYDSWGWMGGHVDGDSDLLHVALKEAKEESGLKDIVPITKEIFTLDVLPVLGHEKNGKYVSAHTHPTGAFLLEADENEKLHIKKDESSGVKWVPIEEMVNLSTEPHLQYVYEKGISKMKKEGYIK